MSMYHMVNGVNPATFLFAPMLSDQHPESHYPRFRDCFIIKRHWEIGGDGLPRMKVVDKAEELNKIYIFTRTGGGNRASYQEQIDEIRKHPNYLTDFDDDFDSTYMTFVFSVPDEYKEDYKYIIDGNMTKVSKSYQERVLKTFPNIANDLALLFVEDVSSKT